MTCVVGIVDGDSIYMGADSCSSGGDYYETTTEEKVFEKDDFIYGYSGSWRIGQLLRYSFVAPDRTTSNVKEYFVTDFIDAFKDCIKDKHNKEESDSWDILVGHCGHLFHIDSYFHVSERSEHNFMSIGSGGLTSDGAMYVLDGEKPTERILQALEAASKFIMSVCPPFIVKRIESNSKKSILIKDAYIQEK